MHIIVRQITCFLVKTFFTQQYCCIEIDKNGPLCLCRKYYRFLSYKCECLIAHLNVLSDDHVCLKYTSSQKCIGNKRFVTLEGQVEPLNAYSLMSSSTHR